MKKKILPILLVLFVLIPITSDAEMIQKDVYVTNSRRPLVVVLKNNKSKRINNNVKGCFTTMGSVNFTNKSFVSSNPKVVSIKNGKITAIKNGKAVLRVCRYKKNGKTVSIKNKSKQPKLTVYVVSSKKTNKISIKKSSKTNKITLSSNSQSVVIKSKLFTAKKSLVKVGSSSGTYLPLTSNQAVIKASVVYKENGKYYKTIKSIEVNGCRKGSSNDIVIDGRGKIDTSKLDSFKITACKSNNPDVSIGVDSKGNLCVTGMGDAKGTVTIAYRKNGKDYTVTLTVQVSGGAVTSTSPYGSDTPASGTDTTGCEHNWTQIIKEVEYPAVYVTAHYGDIRYHYKCMYEFCPARNPDYKGVVYKNETGSVFFPEECDDPCYTTDHGGNGGGCDYKVKDGYDTTELVEEAKTVTLQTGVYKCTKCNAVKTSVK